MRKTSHKSKKQASASMSLKATNRLKKGPLPMKLRALPQSFWQQPNHVAIAPPSASELIPPVPFFCQEDEPGSQLQVSPADTDLLFSLFSTLPHSPQSESRPKTRRGRPRKSEIKGMNRSREEDPYVTSATVPEIKFEKERKAETNTLPYKQDNAEEYPFPTYAQRLQELVVNL